MMAHHKGGQSSALTICRVPTGVELGVCRGNTKVVYGKYSDYRSNLFLLLTSLLTSLTPTLLQMEEREKMLLPFSFCFFHS